MSNSARLWTAVRQAPLSMGFSRQEYWHGLPFPPAGDLPDPGIEPTALRSPALAGRFFTTSATQEPQNLTNLDTTFYINLVQYIQKSILTFFSLIHMLFRSVLFNIKILKDFLALSLLLTAGPIQCSEDIICVISVLNLLRWSLWT